MKYTFREWPMVKKIKRDDKKNKFPLFGLIFIIVAAGFFLFFLNIFDFNMTGFAISSTVSNVVLSSISGNNLEIDNLTVTFDSAVSDQSGVKNITNWFINGSPIAVLNTPFEGGSNSTYTKDYSGFNNVGIVYNGTAWNSTRGHDNFGAYTFDGSNDFIAVNDVTSLDFTNQFTITGWFYYNGDIGSKRLISKENAAGWSYRMGNLDNGIYGFNDALLIQLSADGSANSLSVQINNALSGMQNKWIFHAVTYNGSTLKLYINDAVAGTSTGSINLYNSDAKLGIGADGIGRWPFNGSIDDVILFDRALSQEQIKVLYQNRTDLIVSQETALGDQWRVDVTPNDRTEDGTTISSNTLTIIEADTTAPIINIGSPINKTYTTTSINLNVFANETINTWRYTFDSGTTNTTFTPNISITGAEGANTLIVYANDSSNNVDSLGVNFSVDTIAPKVTINSPENKTYTISTIEFNITTNENADRAGFTIDGGTTNYTMTNNTNRNFNYTLTNVANNNYAAKFYANDSVNNLNNTESINFTVSVSLDNGGGGGGGGGSSLKISKKPNLSATDVSTDNEFSNIKNFSSNLVDEQVELSLIDINRVKGFVDAEYVVKNLADKNQEVKLYFTILDFNETIKSEIEESHTLPANSENIFGTRIPVDKNLNEELILIIDFKKYLSFVSEDAPIRRSISGFSILNSEKNKNNLFVIALFLLFFIFAFFVWRRMIRNRKKKKN